MSSSQPRALGTDVAGAGPATLCPGRTGLGPSAGGDRQADGLAKAAELRKDAVVNLAVLDQPDPAPARAPSGEAGEPPSTRRQIMALIMEQGHATAARLADCLGLTQAAVRRHLAALQAQGLAEVRRLRSPAPRGPGRPAVEWQPTERGRQQFEHAYDQLAVEVLEDLRRLGGEQAVRDFAERKAEAVAAGCRELAAAQPDLDPIQVLSEVLRRDGFMADLASLASGQELRQHHCPYAAVAARFPEFCQAETAAFARLLETHVQRLATIAHGDGVCTTHIPRPGAVPRARAGPAPGLAAAGPARTPPFHA
jgi:predicted ArsR family transcriptional regulator